MTSKRPGVCKRCGRKGTPVRFQISKRGLCRVCAQANMTDAVVQMRQKSGPAYERWRASMRAVADGLDDGGVGGAFESAEEAEDAPPEPGQRAG